MINPFKTKNAIIVRNDGLYKIKSSFFKDIEVTRVELPKIKGQVSYYKVTDESSNVKLIDGRKRKNGKNKIDMLTPRYYCTRCGKTYPWIMQAECECGADFVGGEYEKI